MRLPFLIVSLLLAAAAAVVIGCSGGGDATPTSSACRADFYAAPTELDGPGTVQFVDQSTGEITSWAWDFNENGTIDSTAKHPSYFFDENGTYSITLTVTGPGCEDTVTKTDYIRVSGCKH